MPAYCISANANCIISDSTQADDDGVATGAAIFQPVGKEQVAPAAGAKTTALDLILMDASRDELRAIGGLDIQSQ